MPENESVRDDIMTRVTGQVAQGKPVSVFLEGEYGTGKTSVARFTQWMAERNHGLLGIYATMICRMEQLGTVDYVEGLRLQQERVAQRKAGNIPDTLLLLEHPHVYTLGRNGRREHLLVSKERLAEIGAQVFDSDRGGDITYHGPGQLVGYPILDLTQHRRDVAWYMRSLEEVFVRVAADFGIQAGRSNGATGVWVGDEKLVAMGVHISRWITSHGFAFNLNTDLRYFDYIVPCGLRGKGVTSLAKLLDKPVDMNEVADRVVKDFGMVFGLEMLDSRPSRDGGAVEGADTASSQPL